MTSGADTDGRSDAVYLREHQQNATFVLHSERHEPPSGRRRLDELERAIREGEHEAYLSELLI